MMWYNIFLIPDIEIIWISMEKLLFTARQSTLFS